MTKLKRYCPRQYPERGGQGIAMLQHDHGEYYSVSDVDELVAETERRYQCFRAEIAYLKASIEQEKRLSEALNNESNQRGARIERLERAVGVLSGLDEVDER